MEELLRGLQRLFRKRRKRRQQSANRQQQQGPYGFALAQFDAEATSAGMTTDDETAHWGDSMEPDDIAVIAAILAEDGADDEATASCSSADSRPRQGAGCLERSDEDLEVALQTAIAESLQEMRRAHSTDEPGPTTCHIPESAGGSAALEYPQFPACPICTYPPTANHRTGEVGDHAPLRTYCSQCIQAFHNACLARWFDQVHEDHEPRCPMCRRAMDNGFVQEVKSEWDKSSMSTGQSVRSE